MPRSILPNLGGGRNHDGLFFKTWLAGYRFVHAANGPLEPDRLSMKIDMRLNEFLVHKSCESCFGF